MDAVRSMVGSVASAPKVRLGLGIAPQDSALTVTVLEVPRRPVEVSGRTTRYRFVPALGRTVNEKDRFPLSLLNLTVRHTPRSYRCTFTTSRARPGLALPVTRTS